LLVAGACAPIPDAAGDEDRETILQIHEEMAEAHLAGDVDLWLASQSNEYISVNSGEIRIRDKAERRAGLTPYLERTDYSVFRDLREPIVVISDDGSLGWMITQLEVRGTRTSEAGDTEPFGWTVAAIQLYRKEARQWVLVGDGFNLRPDPTE
jgi:hypothetical protein